MKRGKKLLFGILLLMLVFSVSVFNVKAEDKKENRDFYCFFCTKDKDDPLYKKEMQFNDKIKTIKRVFGDRIDEVALAYTVLHRYGQDYVYNNEYTYNFDENSYENMWKNMYSSISSSLSKLLLSEDDAAKVKANEKIDLLTTAAIVMIDSNNGRYSDVCFKDGLAGNGLVGNTNTNSSFAALQNGLFCDVYETVESSPIEYVMKLFSGDSFLVTGFTRLNRFVNIKKVCKNGYVGGLYPDVTIVKEGPLRENLKKLRAQEIIDFVQYYRFHYGTPLDESEGGMCPVGDVSGSTKGTDLTGTREERIQKIGPAAQAVYSQSGVYASVTIAQAIQESNIGAAGTYGVNNNNLFGVKCRDGKPCQDGYAVFDSIEESISDRVKMFDNGMYPEWRSATTPEEFIRRIGPVYCPVDDGCGDYAGTIIQLINEYDLKKWDVKGNFSSNSNCLGTSLVSGWDIRTIKPSSSDSSFVEMEGSNGNYSNRGQCVWYARGRAYEIVNSLKDKGKLTDAQASHIKELLARAYGNGGDIYDNAKSVFNSSNDVRKPKAGSYIVWKKPGGYGHVAIVEEVNTSSNTITITGGYTSTGSCPSNWNCVQFETKTMSLDAFYEGYGQSYSGGYNFSGYVYFLEPLDMTDTWNVSVESKTCSSLGEAIASLALATAPAAQTRPNEDVHIYEPNIFPWNKVDDERLIPFYNVMDAVYHPGENKAYASCAQAAAAIIKATVDPDFNTANPLGQQNYVKSNPDKWLHAGTVKAFEKYEEKCKPGDILITNDGGWEHTMIYLGNEVVRTRFPNSIGNVWQAGYGEGIHAKYPAIDYMPPAPVSFEIYRPTGGGTFNYPFVDVSQYVDTTNVCVGGTGELTCVNGNAVGGRKSLSRDGNSIARLAARVAGTYSNSNNSGEYHDTLISNPIGSNGAWSKVDDSRLSDYFDLFDKVIANYPDEDAKLKSDINSGVNNKAYASCSQAAAAIIRATVDPDFETLGCDDSTQLKYVENSEKWKRVGEVKAGEKFDDKCNPGDLLITAFGTNDACHAMIYVGNNIAKEFDANTNGNMFEASLSTVSNWAKYPGITRHDTDFRDFYIYRPTGHGSSVYPQQDFSYLLN